MTLAKLTGYGTVLKIDPANGSSFSAIVGVVDKIDGPSVKVTTADTTVLSDWYRTFAATGADPGDVTFAIAASPTNTDLHTLGTLLGNGNVAAFQLVFSDNSQETFHGVVTGLDRKIARGDLVMADLTIKISGSPGYSLT